MARPITTLNSPKSVVIGRSVQGREITLYRFSRRGAPSVLILGGMHGDEPKGATLVRSWLELLLHDRHLARSMNWTLIPVVNPDGLTSRTRRNSHKVDLNRNFPTKDWSPGSRRSRMFGGASPASEPETRAVISAFESNQPDVVVTVHSIGAQRFCNNYDGPARRFAECLHRVNGYPVTGSIGYPTPGSFGTWAGFEMGIPAVTLELPSHHSSKKCMEDNRGVLFALCKALKTLR